MDTNPEAVEGSISINIQNNSVSIVKNWQIGNRKLAQFRIPKNLQALKV